MTASSIIGETMTRTYESRTHGSSAISVEVIDFNPCLESWQYDPPYIDTDPIHPDKDEVERPARFSGQDVTKATVRLEAEDGTLYYRHASLNRTVRTPYEQDDDADWKTSCMIKSKNGIRIGRNGRENRSPQSGRRIAEAPPERPNRPDLHKNDYDMLWDWSVPEPVTLRGNLNRLLANADILFEPNQQNRV